MQIGHEKQMPQVLRLRGCSVFVLTPSGRQMTDLQRFPHPLTPSISQIARRVDQQAPRQVGGDAVCKQLIIIGVFHAAMIDPLVLDVADE